MLGVMELDEEAGCGDPDSVGLQLCPPTFGTIYNEPADFSQVSDCDWGSWDHCYRLSSKWPSEYVSRLHGGLVCIVSS